MLSIDVKLFGNTKVDNNGQLYNKLSERTEIFGSLELIFHNTDSNLLQLENILLFKIVESGITINSNSEQLSKANESININVSGKKIDTMGEF